MAASDRLLLASYKPSHLVDGMGRADMISAANEPRRTSPPSPERANAQAPNVANAQAPNPANAQAQGAANTQAQGARAQALQQEITTLR
ncbi:hypothetical protein BASA82_000006, partial [Batrachochytrium salamandrivorans]